MKKLCRSLYRINFVGNEPHFKRFYSLGNQSFLKKTEKLINVKTQNRIKRRTCEDEEELKFEEMMSQARFSPLPLLLEDDSFIKKLLSFCGSKKTRLKYKSIKLLQAFPNESMKQVEPFLERMSEEELENSLENIFKVVVEKNYSRNKAISLFSHTISLWKKRNGVESKKIEKLESQLELLQKMKAD